MLPLKTTELPFSWWESAINVLLPPRCVATGDVVDRQGMISPAFWRELAFIDNPFCDTCGTPFAIDAPEGSLCGKCLAYPPAFDQARSAVVYNDASRKLVLGFKYGDRLQAVHSFVPWLMRAGAALIDQADVIVPVPLHRKRLWTRRFNQSSILAMALGHAANKICWPDALIRLYATPPQKGLSRKEREDNVKGVFGLNKRYAEKMQDRNVLLIDDVLTSGATIDACTHVLKESGAAKVNVLTIARVTQEDFR